MNSTPSSSHLLVADPDHLMLKEYLIEATGLTFYANRDGELAERISRRMSKLGLSGCAAYLKLLRESDGDGREFDILVAELTIGETHFFRHQEQFDALRDMILPELIERNRQTRRLRIWSAGCATGPEVYSIAMLLRRDLAHSIEGWDVSLLGTDINREFLARANDGVYDDWAFRSCPDYIKSSCFVSEGRNWKIKPEYREGVSFQYHNLVKHPFPSLLHNLSSFDLILCRNVMIYFGTDLIRRLLSQFERSLVPGGWLLVGHAEPNVELFGSFRTINVPGATIYQKSGPQEQAGTSIEVGDGSDTHVRPSALDNVIWRFTPPEPVVASGLDAAVEPVPPQSSDIMVLADRGDFDRALDCAEVVLEKGRLDPVAHFYMALVLEQMGRHAQSEESLRRAIYLDRGFILAHYYLGASLQRRGDKTCAVRSFKNVLDLISKEKPTRRFLDGDGITSADLAELTRMNLDILGLK
jgi:chemotaxis protein methyltransferase CheR